VDAGVAVGAAVDVWVGGATIVGVDEGAGVAMAASVGVSVCLGESVTVAVGAGLGDAAVWHAATTKRAVARRIRARRGLRKMRHSSVR
jgi:tetrahydrodipicolinate N-succinyltransferase